MLAILALALALRSIGIGFGMPFWIANDEQPLIGGALRMLELRNPVPSLNPGPMTILYYPPGIPYLYLVLFLPYLAFDWAVAGLPGAETFAQRLISDLAGPWLIARAFSALAGALTACVIARLAAEVFADRRAGIVAGLLFAVSFHHVLIGHFARVWPPTVLLFWWGLWGAWRVHARGRRIDYVHAALGAGLGFACNYAGVLVSIGVAWAHVVRHRGIVVDRLVLLHAAIVAFFIALFGALYWQNLMRLVGFSPLLAEATGLESRGQRVPMTEMLPHYGGILWTGDPTYALAGTACLAWLLWRRPAATLGALATIACYLAVIFTGTVDDDRYILPATPLLMIAIAGALAAIARRRAAAAMILGCAILLPPLAAGIQLDRLMLRQDTRELARAWVLDKAPAGEGIANAMRAVTLEPSIDALRIQERIEPAGMSAAQRRKLAGQRVLAGGGGREVPAVTAVLQRGVDDPGFGVRLHAELLAAGYRWYLTDDFLDDPRRRPLEPIVRAQGERVARFAPSADGSYGPIFNLANQFERTRFLDVFRVDHLGPVVEIWRMR